MPDPLFPFDSDHVPGSVPSRLAWLHDWTQGPTSFDGKPAAADYYTTAYLNPQGEKGAHAAYGGFTRDRPLESENLAAWARSPAEGLLADYRTMVRHAVLGGCDGIALNLMSTTATNAHAVRQRACLTAADEVPGFAVMLQPDMNTGLVNLTPQALAQYVVGLAKGHRSARRTPDGRLVVSPFKAEAWTPAKWAAFKAEGARLGDPFSMAPCLVNWPTQLEAHAAYADTLGVWGERTPGGAARMRDCGRQVHALGRRWMAPVAVQDYRPRDQVAWESEGFAALTALIGAAIDSNAEEVLVPTANDYSEHSNVLPSQNAGHARLCMLAWGLHTWRHGEQPPTVRPGTIVSQRPHAAAAVPTQQTALATFRGGAPVDIEEWLTFVPGRPLERAVGPASYPAERPTRQDLTYHSTLTVMDDPVPGLLARVAELEGALAVMTSRATTAEEQVAELRDDRAVIHALSAPTEETP